MGMSTFTCACCGCNRLLALYHFFGVEASVGSMLVGRPFQFVEVQGVAFGAAQGCQ